MTIAIPAPSERIINGGQLVITSGIQNWVDTGVEPWASEPNPHTLSKDWRSHYVAVIVTSHLSGDQGDTCPEDHHLNREVFENLVVAVGCLPSGIAMVLAKSLPSLMITVEEMQ